MFFTNRRINEKKFKFLKSSKQFHRINTINFHVHLIKFYYIYREREMERVSLVEVGLSLVGLGKQQGKF